MGCASSAHMIPSTSESLTKPHPKTTLESAPTDEVVLKDLPEVVEKIIEVLKETESDDASGHKTEIATMHPLNSEVESSPTEVDASQIIHDTDSDSSLQGIVQGFLVDSASTNSKQSGEIEEHYNFEHNSPTVSADIDSLRTSSPESEIEEALANSNDQNPPTPKPTFSELRNLAMFPINAIVNNYVKPEDDSISLISENTKVKKNSQKAEIDIPEVPKFHTDWEKQADMLAKTQKFNPIDALRKYRKENRSSSSLPHREDFKPKSQRHFEEDLSDFVPVQSPLRSALSSARSERPNKSNSSEPDSNSIINKVRNHAHHKKMQDIKIKKPPDTKRKDTNLTVSQNARGAPSPNARGAPSPSLYKVRERCAVCCNKYKH